jgi:hypothetical protein
LHYTGNKEEACIVTASLLSWIRSSDEWWTTPIKNQSTNWKIKIVRWILLWLYIVRR